MTRSRSEKLGSEEAKKGGGRDGWEGACDDCKINATRVANPNAGSGTWAGGSLDPAVNFAAWPSLSCRPAGRAVKADRLQERAQNLSALLIVLSRSYPLLISMNID